MNNRNFSKASEAVSPVVATLLLVLVAAGAAIGFGVFLNGFQKNTQSKVSNEAPAEVLHIGGSSTVFELTEKALPTWKAQHPSIQIDDQEGGSTAGKVAICRGTVDIGAESSPFAATGPLPSQTTCPVDNNGVKVPGKSIQVFTVGYDGVAMAFKTGACVGSDASHGFTPAIIRELYAVNGRSGFPQSGSGNGVILATAPAAGTPYTWTDLVTANVCASTGEPANTPVVLGSRLDPSGTEDGFCGLVLVYKQDGTHCTNDNYDQLVDAFYNNVNPQPGNDGIAAWLTAGSGDRLSFVGFGNVASSNGALGATTFGTTVGALVAPGTGAIKAAGADANLPGAGNGAGKGCLAQATAGEYCATRALQYMTQGTPTATEQLFLDFMMSTLNNENFNAAAGYVSLY